MKVSLRGPIVELWVLDAPPVHGQQPLIGMPDGTKCLGFLMSIWVLPMKRLELCWWNMNPIAGLTCWHFAHLGIICVAPPSLVLPITFFCYRRACIFRDVNEHQFLRLVRRWLSQPKEACLSWCCIAKHV